jgi:hypothetical protein
MVECGTWGLDWPKNTPRILNHYEYDKYSLETCYLVIPVLLLGWLSRARAGNIPLLHVDKAHRAGPVSPFPRKWAFSQENEPFYKRLELQILYGLDFIYNIILIVNALSGHIKSELRYYFGCVSGSATTNKIPSDGLRY